MPYDGKTYGFPDDGDVMIMYYRKDVFEDPELKAILLKFLAGDATWREASFWNVGCV